MAASRRGAAPPGLRSERRATREGGASEGGMGRRVGPRRRAGNTVPSSALVLTGILSVQVGAGLAARMFSQVTPAQMTGLRLWSSALLVAALGGRELARSLRDLVRERAWRDAAVAVAFGVTLGIMNYSICQSFARIPLGIAVTIEFLGPLAVAVASSRRLIDLVWVGLAGAGVALLSSGWASLAPGRPVRAGTAGLAGSRVALAPGPPPPRAAPLPLSPPARRPLPG